MIEGAFREGRFRLTLDDFGAIEGRYSLSTRMAEIQDMDIDGPEQGRGYGRKLYRAFEAKAHRLGIRTIGLSSYDDSHGFWEKMGFVGPPSNMQKVIPE